MMRRLLELHMLLLLLLKWLLELPLLLMRVLLSIQAEPQLLPPSA
jgi:hypothetical protein